MTACGCAYSQCLTASSIQTRDFENINGLMCRFQEPERTLGRKAITLTSNLFALSVRRRHSKYGSDTSGRSSLVLSVIYNARNKKTASRPLASLGQER